VENNFFAKNEKKSRSPQTIDITTKIACLSEEKQTILAGEEGFELPRRIINNFIKHNMSQIVQ
jgi:hypothetical protein